METSVIVLLTPREFNIYKDSAVPEVKRAFPVVNAIITRVKELLAEWPDHPGLIQVRREFMEFLIPAVTLRSLTPYRP